MAAHLWRTLIAGLFVVALAALVSGAGTAHAAPYAAVVIDARSGEILHARNHDTRLHPASLTKMMTLYVTFEAVENGEIGLDTPVTVSRNAASEPCSCLGLSAGQSIALRYLIRAAAVRSGNDAATAIGEAIAGSEAAFAQRMTRTARAIGMENTTFQNAHGLTRSGHLSTARDMALLARQLYFDYPQYYNLFSRITTDAGLRTVRNTNRSFLNSYNGADGIKTGFTNAAGFNLAASAERNGARIIAVIFGGTSVANRNARMTELLDMGFARAPVQVALRPPDPPTYAGAGHDGGRMAGRTIRLDTAVRTSPRPRARPLPEPSQTVIAELETNIDNVLAEVRAADVTAPPPRPEDAPAEAAAPQPDTADTATQTVASAVDEAVNTAVAPPPEAGDTDSDDAAVARLANEAPADAPPAADEDEAAIILTSSPAPPSRPEDLRMASADAQAEPPEPRREVVSRISSSGGRLWGINIGRYTTRHRAERSLMRTALSESSVLDGALRRIGQGSNGFDANFVGLSREQADLACRRLQARGQQCFTIAP